MLAQRPENISLLTVVEAVEGKIVAETDRDRESVLDEDFRPGFVWDLMASSLCGALNGITIECLVRRASREAVPRSEPGSMYFI